MFYELEAGELPAYAVYISFSKDVELLNLNLGQHHVITFYFKMTISIKT